MHVHKKSGRNQSEDGDNLGLYGVNSTDMAMASSLNI